MLNTAKPLSAEDEEKLQDSPVDVPSTPLDDKRKHEANMRELDEYDVVETRESFKSWKS